MKRLITAVMFCLFVMACTPKGEEGGKCLEDRSCNNSTLVCTKENKCTMCGRNLDEGCCPGDPPWCLIGACNSQNLCVSTYCPPGGECYICGNLNKPCCESGQCMYGMACNAEGNCEYCGGKHQLPCPIIPCEGFFRPYDNICDNPFHQGDTISVKECQLLSNKTDETAHSQEWCFWFVAYNLEDFSVCNLIQWEQMRSLCSQGENPDDYYSIITIN